MPIRSSGSFRERPAPPTRTVIQRKQLRSTIPDRGQAGDTKTNEPPLRRAVGTAIHHWRRGKQIQYFWRTVSQYVTRTVKLLMPFDLVIPLGECFPYNTEKVICTEIFIAVIFIRVRNWRARRLRTGLTEQTGSMLRSQGARVCAGSAGVKAHPWAGRRGSTSSDQLRLQLHHVNVQPVTACSSG